MKKIFVMLLGVACMALASCTGGNTPDDPKTSDVTSMTSKIVAGHTVYEVTFKSGEKMWFGVHDELNTPTELSLVSAFAYYGSGDLAKSLKYKGDIVVPASFKYDGVTYTVTKLDVKLAPPFKSCGEITSVTLPGTISEIDEFAFSYCTRMEKINLTDGLKSIGQQAFQFDSALVEINIPNTVTYIEHSAFSFCDGLKSFRFPDGITHVKDCISCCNHIETIYLPKSVRYIDAIGSANAALQSVTCEAVTPPSTLPTESGRIYSPFSGCASSVIFYVPAASVDAYKAAEFWRDVNVLPIP